MSRLAKVVVLLLTSRSALAGNQAVSPPPSIFEWLQPFRPIITVSKFPPVVEFIAQRIQAQFSNYIYEDLSRPSTYDRPTYKPYVAPTTAPTPDAQDGVENGTESLVIPTVAPPRIVMVDEYVITSNSRYNQSVQIEYQLKNVINLINNTGAPQEASEIVPDKTKIALEQEVHLIMKRNDLKENFTHVFERSNLNEKVINDGDSKVVHDFITYKDVSGLFTNIGGEQEEFARNVLRTNQGQSELKRNRKMIALTKIGEHVYVNVITLTRQ